MALSKIICHKKTALCALVRPCAPLCRHFTAYPYFRWLMFLLNSCFHFFRVRKLRDLHHAFFLVRGLVLHKESIQKKTFCKKIVHKFFFEFWPCAALCGHITGYPHFSFDGTCFSNVELCIDFQRKLIILFYFQ